MSEQFLPENNLPNIYPHHNIESEYINLDEYRELGDYVYFLYDKWSYYTQNIPLPTPKDTTANIDTFLEQIKANSQYELSPSEVEDLTRAAEMKLSFHDISSSATKQEVSNCLSTTADYLMHRHKSGHDVHDRIWIQDLTCASNNKASVIANILYEVMNIPTNRARSLFKSIMEEVQPHKQWTEATYGEIVYHDLQINREALGY